MAFSPDLVTEKCLWMLFVACLGTNLQFHEVRNTKHSAASALGRVWDIVDAQ